MILNNARSDGPLFDWSYHLWSEEASQSVEYIAARISSVLDIELSSRRLSFVTA